MSNRHTTAAVATAARQAQPTTAVATAATAPHRAAVRIGNGAAVHAGTRAAHECDRDGVAHYVPACGTGNGWRGDVWNVTTAPATDSPITCRNCITRHAATVARIEEAAAIGRAYDPTDRGIRGERLAAAVDLVATMRVQWFTQAAAATGAVADALRKRAAVCDVHLTTLRDKIDRENDPRAVASRAWHAITDAAAGNRLRAAWVRGAYARAYTVPIVCDDRDAVIERERLADLRPSEVRAREYLAAYACEILARGRVGAPVDERAEPVDRVALDYVAPTDAQQEAAGLRPPVGSLVMVGGRPGAWKVAPRTEECNRRHPYDIRLQQPNHPLSVSVALAAVRVLPADVEDTSPGAWVAVTVGAGRAARNDVAGWGVYDATTGRAVGAITRNDAWMWRAERVGGRVGMWKSDQGAALADVGFLPTITAAELVEATAGDAVRPVSRLVLSSGAVVRVTGAESYTWPHAQRDGVWRPAEQTTTDVVAEHDGLLTLTTAREVAGLRVGRDGKLRFKLGTADRVALAPPCDWCSDRPGVACAPYCPSLLACDECDAAVCEPYCSKHPANLANR